jgi:hypothetical protein
MLVKGGLDLILLEKEEPWWYHYFTTSTIGCLFATTIYALTGLSILPGRQLRHCCDDAPSFQRYL